VKKC